MKTTPHNPSAAGRRRVPYRLASLVLAGSAAMSLVASAQTSILAEDFGVDVQNPMDDPSTTTVVPWTYAGPGGNNSSRLFNPNGNGGGYSTPGWISIVDGSTITTTISLAALAGDATLESGGNLFDTNVYSLTFEHCTETSVASRISTFSVDVASSGTIGFISGGNEDGSQSFTGLSDEGENGGGTVGSTPERRWTLNFMGTSLTTTDTITLTLGRVTSTAGFTFIDNVGLEAKPPGTAPTVVVTAGTALSSTSIEAAGEVTDTGGDDPTVTIYYGITDGSEDPMSWDDSVALGTQTGVFFTDIDGLLPSTTYFYRALASNAAGDDWSDTAEMVTTLTPVIPTVVVDPGLATSASTGNIGGEVTDIGNEIPNVTLYYGTTDGGMVTTAWDASIDLGRQDGLFSSDITGLEGGTTYHFRALATNSAGDGWSATAETFTTDPFTGVTAGLNSGNFDYMYEMDVNPNTQDLDAAGQVDFFWNPAQSVGPDQTMDTPQTYAGGIATSNQAGTDPDFYPEALFRTDYGGSIQRQSISGDFTLEVSIKLTAGTIVDPVFDLGGFGLYLNPASPTTEAFRLNISETETTLGTLGTDVVTTGSNTDAFHTFRVAYVENDRRYWVWRDDVLIYGTDVAPGGGVIAEEAFLWDGGMMIGDFAADITGDWEIDYLRLHNEAVEPAAFAADLKVTDFGFVDANTVYLDFVGAADTPHDALSSTTMLGGSWTTETAINGSTGMTDGSGVGRIEVDVTGRTSGALFFQIEQQ